MLVEGILSSLMNELSTMVEATDDVLWDVINPSVTQQQRDRLNELNAWGGERDLTPVEHDEQETLRMEHHRSILRRAQAIAVLIRRGYSISDDVLQSAY